MICENEFWYLAVKLLAVIGFFSVISVIGIVMCCVLSKRIKNEATGRNISN